MYNIKKNMLKNTLYIRTLRKLRLLVTNKLNSQLVRSDEFFTVYCFSNGALPLVVEATGGTIYHAIGQR